MKQQYVPPEKRTKKKQKELNEMKRKDWNGVNPATKKVISEKIYNRKKSGRWNEYEPSPGFFLP
jgi:hypothetical protein